MICHKKTLLVQLQFLGLLIFIGACSSSPGVRNLQSGNKQATFEWTSLTDEITIPFKWHDGHIIIPVTVNESEPLQMAFDSGAAVTVLFESGRTSSLKLNIERQLTLNSSGQIANVINSNTIGLSSVTLKNLTILHVPLKNSPIFSNIDEAYFDGAIGYDLLSRFAIMIDYVGQTITLSRKQPAAINLSEWQALPIDTEANVPYLEVSFSTDNADELKSNTSKLLVDTGAPFYLYINPELDTEVELPVQYYETIGKSFNGPYHRYTGRLGSLNLGRYRFSNLAAHFDKADFRDLDGVGLLGNALLKNFDLIFDYSSGILFIRSNTEFSAQSTLDKSGLDIKPHNEGAIVTSVAPNTAADAVGLKARDIITGFDLTLISPENFDEFKTLLSSEKAKTRLCWMRNAKRKCAELMLSPRV